MAQRLYPPVVDMDSHRHITLAHLLSEPCPVLIVLPMTIWPYALHTKTLCVLAEPLCSLHPVPSHNGAVFGGLS